MDEAVSSTTDATIANPLAERDVQARIVPDAEQRPLPAIADSYEWACKQAEHIRAGRFDEVDLLNVAEEIEGVGNNELHRLTSNAEIVILHILKWQFQPSKRSRSWVLSIAEHRVRVRRDLRRSPSLAAKLDVIIIDAFDTARLRAARQTRLPLSSFPSTCPFDRHAILDLVFELDNL